MGTIQPMLPTQNNSSDCGVFLLKYVQEFLSEARPVAMFNEKNHRCAIVQLIVYELNIAYSKWFPVEQATELRQGIHSVIKRLHALATAGAEEKAADSEAVSEEGKEARSE